MTSPVFLFISGLARPFVKSTPKLICLLPIVVVIPVKLESIETSNETLKHYNINFKLENY